MVVGTGKLVFRLHECHSLKTKRSIVKAIIKRMQDHFNASVAEVGANDMHQRAEIGFAMIGNDHRLINSKIDLLLNMADAIGIAEMIDSEMEIISL
ncbi:MAG: DUF503 domain-containing protein [Proteobacteria bacterium]|nr:DUF503 domain-containing protein [Desulfobacteraceae bacterium]MBU4002087.1 DUF503 domain-containing protein [Pseudomonadota bacterium]MBU4317913.1 DUF503 domain-containing protein [Pseudomonadota bacterium]MBU4470080.1 DUF503 domain-containing protein [Pseudomonadota bacterium]MCG2750725.1 DUF503 domain-containing protein [Desulfobacteraceae bacterium]